MTTPTRKQVVQWADDSGFNSIDDPYHNQIEIADSGNLWITKRLETFSTLARADLEATIAEQAAELESLRKDAERYRYIKLLHDDPDGEVGVCEYEESRDEWLFVTKDLGKYLDAAIAPPPKQEK